MVILLSPFWKTAMPSEESSFSDLIRRVRAGDEAAAAEVMRQYEPEIRRIVRIRLNNSSLRKLLDSTDICQSVMANFFLRAASGQFELDTPEQMLKLLVTMACNKLRDKYRQQTAQKRGDSEGRQVGSEALAGVASPDAGPAHTLAMKELLGKVHEQLSSEERYLVEQRIAGRDWADLAAELGGTPEALRKRHARALDRVGQQLGLEEVEDE